MDTRLRKWLKKEHLFHLAHALPLHTPPQALGGLGVPCCEDEMHVARASQAFKFLADTRDPTVRSIAILQLKKVVRTRAHIPRASLLTMNNLVAFLNTPAPSQEGARGHVKSVWSSVRASLHFTNSALRLTPDSATILANGIELSWHAACTPSGEPDHQSHHPGETLHGPPASH